MTLPHRRTPSHWPMPLSPAGLWTIRAIQRTTARAGWSAQSV